MRKAKKNWNLIIGLSITGVILAAAVAAQFWTPYSITEMDSSSVNLAPSLIHLMGTDNFGRDIFSRAMNGIGVTFLTAFASVAIGAFFGIILGAFTGYYGGVFDEMVMLSLINI